MLLRRRTALIALPLLALACGSTTIIHQSGPGDTPGTTDDAGDDLPDASVPDTFVPDAAPPEGFTFPHVESRGGPVIQNPKVVPIVFTGDAMKSSITTFTAKIASSSFWSAAGAEYQVGAITPGTTITVNEAAPTTITSDQIDQWLISKLSGASPAFGAPDSNTLYAIYYPASTTITDDGSGLGQSCQGYGGYHYETSVGGKKIGYAVLPRCSDIDDLTIAASHEYFEWATDPFPLTTPAFNKLDDDHWAWGVTMLGELGDLCTFLDRDNLRPTEVGYLIQPMWSNKASLAGHYPCPPNALHPFYAAVTTANDAVIVPDTQEQGVTLTTKAVNVPPGKSRTVDVQIYSDKKSSAQVPLRALSYADFAQSGQPSGFTYSLSKDYAAVGETIQVTISAPTADNYDMLVMMAYTSDETAFYWPVLVVNQPTAFRGPIHAPTAMSKRGAIRTTKLGLPKAAQWKLPALPALPR